MSTVGEVVDRAGKLVGSVAALLETQSVTEVLKTAAALGAQQALVNGFTVLQGGLGRIDQGLAPVISTLIGIDAAAGAFGLVPPVVKSVGVLVTDSGELFTELVPGLVDAQQLTQAATEVIESASQQIGAASQFADETLAYINPASFKNLRSRLLGLSATLDGLKQKALAPPTTSQSQE